MSQQLAGESRQNRSDGIALVDVSHAFGSTDVLDEVTVSVSPGETLAVIGPSGTGKTTLLRLFAMFHPPDQGSVDLEGSDVWAGSEADRLAARRRIGMVFQQANLFDASVVRNVSYGLHIRRSWEDRLKAWASRVLGNEVDEPVIESLELVGMGEAAGQDADSLSGGEAQRVAFARAFAVDPDFLLLDEPTSDLDPRNTAVIEEAVESARRRGLGVVIATHDMNQAKRVADRAAVMIEGRLIEVGPTERVFENPHDPRARQFIEGELVY